MAGVAAVRRGQRRGWRKERQVPHGAEGKGWDSQPVSARGTVGMSYRGLLPYLAWKEMSLCFWVHISIILGVK